LPIVIEYFKNSFVNNPIVVQSFDGSGNQLLTFEYKYEHAEGLRVKRIQKDILDTQVISTDTLRYLYQR
jgi:hypothetical protein